VQDGIALQHCILEEMREKAAAVDILRRSKAASSLDWSRRSDEILDNMAIVEGIARELSKKADDHAAEILGLQLDREKELMKVTARAQQDAKLLSQRTAAQLELMRHATHTIVRCVTHSYLRARTSLVFPVHYFRDFFRCCVFVTFSSEMSWHVKSLNGRGHLGRIFKSSRQSTTMPKSYGTANSKTWSDQENRNS
jgi:hypothetical protein